MSENMIVKDISLLDLAFSDVIQAMDFSKFYKGFENTVINRSRKNIALQYKNQFTKHYSIVDLLTDSFHFDNTVQTLLKVDEVFDKFEKDYNKIMVLVKDFCSLNDYSESLIKDCGDGYSNIFSRDLQKKLYLIDSRKMRFNELLIKEIIDSFFDYEKSEIRDYTKMLEEEKARWIINYEELASLNEFFYKAIFPDDKLEGTDFEKLKNINDSSLLKFASEKRLK